MGVKTVIGFPNQFAVKALFASAGLVPRNKQNRFAPGIKSESYSPFAVNRAESQFLHVGVAGAFQGVKRGADLIAAQTPGERAIEPESQSAHCHEEPRILA